MNGFLVVGSNNTQDSIQTDIFEQHLKSEKKQFRAHKLKSSLFENILGYQIFNNISASDSLINPNVFFNGKIFGLLRESNKRKLTYSESLIFISENIKQHSSFFGFDGSCSLVMVDNLSFIIQNDIEGYKKVFYYDSKDIFCVSSNLTYILKIIKKNWRVRKNAIFSYILQRESKWPLTFIEEINVLPPLTKAILTENGITFENAILSDFYSLKKVNKDQLIEDVYDSYQTIINRETSTNIAVTLSGGFDSNCLTKLYSQSYSNKFTAVSLGYSSKRKKDSNVYDETIYAEKTAKYLNIPFKKYIVDKKYFYSQIDSFIKTIDQPGHDPSSNFLLNDLLKKDGFDSVVTGMGGDALFSSKSSSKLSEYIFKLAINIGCYKYLNLISKQLNFRGILNIFNSESYNKYPQSFMELKEIRKLNNSALDNFMFNKVKGELYNEVGLRLGYYNKIEKKAKVSLERYYLYSLLSNPDEYHADIMAQRNNLNIVMPFVSTIPVLKLLNGSKYINITNRQFEMELFNGINKNHLLGAKSGFSFPYSEWTLDLFAEVAGFFKETNYLKAQLFNFDKFEESYKNDERIRNSVSANQLIWKLLIVKRYIEYHKLEEQSN